jgi:hypothetical protein
VLGQRGIHTHAVAVEGLRWSTGSVPILPAVERVRGIFLGRILADLAVVSRVVATIAG